MAHNDDRRVINRGDRGHGSAGTCTVAVLPTLHDLHKDPAFGHYDYNILRSLILTFDPDCICGEVRPEDWEATAGGTREGYCGPVEYRECILPLCRERGIAFRPIDAYRDEDVAESNQRSGGEAHAGSRGNSCGVAQKDSVETAWQAVTDVFLQLIRRSECGVRAFFDPAVMEVIRVKHRLQQQALPVQEARLWQARNLRMAANIVDVCAEYLGGRVLVTVGLEHVPFLWDLLSLSHAVRLMPIDWARET